MLRAGNTIRMTADELAHFRSMTGRPEIPQTVADYNRAVDAGEKDWANVGTPEGKLLAAMTKSLRILDATE